MTPLQTRKLKFEIQNQWQIQNPKSLPEFTLFLFPDFELDSDFGFGISNFLTGLKTPFFPYLLPDILDQK